MRTDNRRHLPRLADRQGFDRTQEFTIKSDFDLSAALNRPHQVHIEYFLVPSPPGVLDSIDRRHPGGVRSGRPSPRFELCIPATGYG